MTACDSMRGDKSQGGVRCPEPAAYLVYLVPCESARCDGMLCAGHPFCVEHAAHVRRGGLRSLHTGRITEAADVVALTNAPVGGAR